MRQYGKYGLVALNAINKIEHYPETTPQDVWENAALSVFLTQSSSRVKDCPKSAFLGLCELGAVKGVAKGKYTSSVDNKKYAEDALSFLKQDSNLENKELWDLVINNKTPKQHNSQMNVVLALFNEGYLK